MKDYIFPIITIALLGLFFLGMPELSSIPACTKLSSREGRRIDRVDALIMAVVTVIFAFVDFARLGNTDSPETFAFASGKSVVLTPTEDTVINRILIFTGAGTGTYEFSFSDDGENYTPACEINQDYASVLSWKDGIPEETTSPKAVRMTCSGNAWVGEVFLLDIYDEPIAYTCSVPELCDEQDVYYVTADYMNSSYFDEIYHARTAWEHLNNVYPYEITHPPLGKLIISLGIMLFGMTPFGWRFSGTLFGVLMLPLMYIFAKKLFGSRRSAFAVMLLMATDFMHYTQTRIATIDTYSVFFIILMYLFMYLYISEDRPLWLALSGVAFGLGAASKWTSLYAGAGLAVIWAAYRIYKRRDGFRAFIKNCLFCVVFFILIPCVIYYLSYIPYGTASGVTNIFSADYLDIVISNQEYMFSYHSNLSATHPYSSVWYQWVLDIRPILYYLQYYPGDFRSSFGAFVNPVLCWGGLIAVIVLVYRAVSKRDATAAFIVVGYLAQLVPWMFVTRLTFEYHYFPCTVFLALALGYIFKTMEVEGRMPRVCIYSLCGLSLGLFVLFYPALSGLRVYGPTASALLKWLPTWPF